MLQIIKTSSLVGQSIISYLQKKGYPEIALQFVQDTQTRFELAIECGNLEVATEMAKELDRPKVWTRLGTEALIHGNHQIVEMTYQKLRHFDKLSFLYLCTGNGEKLTRMSKIAEHRNDFVSRFQNALYLGDVEGRIQMFKEIDLYPLAYLTAKSHGLTEECASILELCGLTEDQISMPQVGHGLKTPKVIVPTYKANWPVKEASHSSFENALLGEVGAVVDDAQNPDLLNEDVPEIADKSGQAAEEDVDAGEGWDMGDDLGLDTAGNDSDFVNVDNPDLPTEAAGPGSSEADIWSRNSPLAADHVAAGSFDSAMQLLNRQVGAVNFEPLKPRFLEIYQASRTYLPANAGLPPIVNYVRRNVDETDSRKLLPVIPRDLEILTSNDLQEGYTAMRTNKLESGVVVFKQILQSLLVNVVNSQAQVDEAKVLIAKAMEYTLAMSIELERRRLSATDAESPEQLKRQLELSAYFTMPKLDVSHRQLALMAAMKLAFSNKQFSSALSFANRVLANGGAPKLVEQVSLSSSQAVASF
jgi:coatomer protein complex subunit alpha (xenin)